MKKTMIRFMAITLMLGIVNTVFSCPACYGDPKSAETAGVNAAIITMLGITGFVLTGISAFFVLMRRRFNSMRQSISEHSTVNEEGELTWNNF